MAYSSRRRSRYHNSRSPYRSLSRSSSPVSYRYRDEDDEDARNPGNNLYVTGLSARVTEKDLEERFEREGKVIDCHLVLDPRTKESRGFAFVTMKSLDDAERCIKHLDKSILEGRVITVEKARRKRARTPTPGKYLGVRTMPRSSYYSDRRNGYSDRESLRRSPRYSPYRRGGSSPEYSPRGRSRHRNPSVSPEDSWYRRSHRSYYRSRSTSRSRSLSPRHSPYAYSRSDRCYRSRSPVHRSGYYSSRSPSPYRSAFPSPYRSAYGHKRRSPSPYSPYQSPSRSPSSSPSPYRSCRYRSRSPSPHRSHYRRRSRSPTPYKSQYRHSSPYSSRYSLYGRCSKKTHSRECSPYASPRSYSPESEVSSASLPSYHRR